MEALFASTAAPHEDVRRIYSDIPAMILKYVLEAAAGMSFMDCVRKLVLEPAGMTETWSAVPPERRKDCQCYDREHRIENGQQILREGWKPGVPHDPKAAVIQGGRAENQALLGGIATFSSVLTNPELGVVIQALSQHGGTDLLSAPRVTTRSGVNAQIQVVREIIYPTEFDLTQPTVDGDGNVTMAPVVTPGGFEPRETGVILNVPPSTVTV